jgi:hypothetical protein
MARGTKAPAVREAKRHTRQDELDRLYLRDETAWLDKMARLLREERLEELDRANLVEFLESMAASQRREVMSRLRTLIAHLLKWDYQPQVRSRSWMQTIINQRLELETILESKTLRKHAAAILDKAYSGAVKLAAFQTKKPADDFPKKCPYSLDHVLTAELSDHG